MEQKVIDHVGSYGRQLGTILKMLDLLERHTQLTGLDKTDQGDLDEFNSSPGIHGPPSPSRKASSAKEMTCWLQITFKKAAKGEFGDHIFNDLKELFTTLSKGNDETSK